MKNRKYLWMVTFLVLLGAMMVACGGSGEPPPPTQAPATATPITTSTPAPSPTPSAEDHLAIGLEYYEQDQLEAALAEFKRAIELEPDNADAHRNLGSVYVKWGEWEEAVISYEKAIELAPDFGKAYGDVVAAYINLGELKEAIAVGEKAIELTPDYAKAHNNLGVAYEKQGQIDKAITEYQEAIRLDPNDVMPHYNLGLAYYRQEKIEAAIAKWEDTIQIDPDYASAYKNLGVVYRDLGRAEEAIANFETYLQLFPDSPDKTVVEQDIAKLKGGQQGLTDEYVDPFGNYKLNHPDQWTVQRDEPGIVILGSDESDANAIFAILAKPRTFFESELDVPEIVNAEQFAEAVAPAYDIDPQTLTPGLVNDDPAWIGDWGEPLAGQEMTGQIVFLLSRGMGYVLTYAATPDMWAEFELVGQAMLDSFTTVEPSLTEEYTNAAAGYTLPYPDGWAIAEEETFTKFTPLPDLEPNDAPYVAIFAGQDNIAEAFQVEGEFNDLNIIAAFNEMMAARVANRKSETFGGQPATSVQVNFDVDGLQVGGLMIIFEQTERPLVVLGVSPASQWTWFARTFNEMLDNLAFSASSTSSDVDFSDPTSVVQAIFTAAQTEDFSVLPNLCDPQGENDDDTALICAITDDHTDKDRFVEYFAKGKLNGEPVISDNQAQAPFLFGPDGDQEETMVLIKRGDTWYLLGF